MELNEYQDRAMTTCMDSCANFSYMSFNLMGEVGKFTGKVAKWVRRGWCQIKEGQFTSRVLTGEEMAELRREAGDILWQLSGLCNVMGWSLEDVAQENLSKLAARKVAGTIDGSGDGITPEERGVRAVVKAEVETASPAKPRKITKRKGYKRTKDIVVLRNKPDKRMFKAREALVRDGVDINMVYHGESELKIKGYKWGHKVYYAYGDYMRLQRVLTGRLF